MIVVNKKWAWSRWDKEWKETHTHTPLYFVHVAIVYLSRRECVLLLNQNHVFYRKITVFSSFISYQVIQIQSLPIQIFSSGRIE